MIFSDITIFFGKELYDIMMKGRFLKKAAALVLSAVLVTGGVPLQPIADMFGAAVTASAYGTAPTAVTDTLTRTETEVTGNSYTEWTYTSTAFEIVYKGNSAGGNSSIQLNDNNNSGIVKTSSGGKAKKITVEWNSNTASGRDLRVYGKNSAYVSPSDLYNSSDQGDWIGTISCGTSTEYSFTDDYEYIGVRSASGAIYLDSIAIEWEKDLPGDGTEENPHLISSAEDWNELSYNVANGTDYSGEYFKLTNNITVTTIVGVNDHSGNTGSKPFAGTFDGDGHVLKVNINSPSTHGAAPFGCVKNAVIKNLIVEGTVNGNIHSAGLVGVLDNSDGNSVSIQNVVVNTDVTDTSITVGETSGGYVGGIIGHARTATVTLTNCAFGGTLSASNCAGGLIGWGDGGANGYTLHITNCSFTGALSEPSPVYFQPIGLASTLNTAAYITYFYTNNIYNTDNSCQADIN